LSCAPYYKHHIARPSERTELECISMVVPSGGNWGYLRANPPGEDCWMLGRGGIGRSNLRENLKESETYNIFIVFLEKTPPTIAKDWDDELDNEYMLNKAKEYIEAQKKDFMGNKKIGMDYFNYEVKIVDGIKDYCVEIKYEYSYFNDFENRPAARTNTVFGRTYGREREFFGEKLNPSDKYFDETIEFLVIEPEYKEPRQGLFKAGGENDTLSYRVIFRHHSLNEQRDPELESKALEFLKNLEPTDYFKKVEVE